jgi:hypothetical protein
LWIEEVSGISRGWNHTLFAVSCCDHSKDVVLENKIIEILRKEK